MTPSWHSCDLSIISSSTSSGMSSLRWLLLVFSICLNCAHSMTPSLLVSYLSNTGRHSLTNEIISYSYGWSVISMKIFAYSVQLKADRLIAGAHVHSFFHHFCEPRLSEVWDNQWVIDSVVFGDQWSVWCRPIVRRLGLSVTSDQRRERWQTYEKPMHYLFAVQWLLFSGCCGVSDSDSHSDSPLPHCY